LEREIVSETIPARDLRNVADSIPADVEEEAEIRKRIAKIMAEFSGDNARSERGEAHHKYESAV